MPNTPALVGKGMTGLFARPRSTLAGQALIERVIGTTGQLVWVDAEDKLDAVTALSGSGPAYVFLFLEAMTQAGVDMGLTAAQSYQLAIATFQGASELAARSDEPASVLRERVTSKGGTTYAAITHMQQARLPSTSSPRCARPKPAPRNWPQSLASKPSAASQKPRQQTLRGFFMTMASTFVQACGESAQAPQSIERIEMAAI